MTGCGQALGIVADDIVAQTAATEAWRNGKVVPAGKLDGLLAADDRHPDLGMGLLYGSRPDRHVFVGPKLALVGEYILGPCPRHDLVRLLETGATFGQRHVVHLVFARDAARETRDQPAVRQAVEHRKLLGKPQRTALRSSGAVASAPWQGSLHWTYVWSDRAASSSSEQRTLSVEFAAKAADQWFVNGWGWNGY